LRIVADCLELTIAAKRIEPATAENFAQEILSLIDDWLSRRGFAQT
jgi:hypothetical protein